MLHLLLGTEEEFAAGLQKQHELGHRFICYNLPSNLNPTFHQGPGGTRAHGIMLAAKDEGTVLRDNIIYAGGRSGSALYVGQGGDDFRLQEGSPCKGQADDGGDLGARGSALTP